jgi:DNA-binding winged helix-turn-helix (wHTH) protein
MPDTSSAPRRVLVGQAVCDFDQLTLEADGDVTRLEPRLAGVLAVLVQHAGATLSRDELLTLAWEADASDEALTQAISRLRKLLGDRKAIETIPRIGYRLTAPVTPAPATIPARPPAPAAPPAADGLASFIRQRWLRSAALLILAAATGALLALWLFGGGRTVEREFEVQPAEDREIEFIPQDEAEP